jgi:hypothetical protein
VIRSLRSRAPLLVVALIALSGCDSESPNAPTPTPTPAAPAPAPTPPPPPTPPAPAALESITLSPSVVNISVAAGETTNSFSIDTSTVRDPTTVRISARYESVTMTAELTVLPPPLEAQFRVVSALRGDDACVIVTAAGGMDCVFDASRSTGFPSVYRWTLTVAGKDLTLNMPEGSATFVPATDCNFLSGGNISSDGEVAMLVVLRVEDRQGNVSSGVQRIIDLVPNGMCGY